MVVRRRLARRRRMPTWFRRHPSLYWVAVVALAALSAQTVAGAVSRADSARARWGTAQSILAAHHRLEVGDVITTADVSSESWPAAMVPRGAIAAADAIAGRTVVETIEPGEAVLSVQLAPDGLHGLAALVPVGWRALALPVEQVGVALTVGDRVDLVAAVDGADAQSSPPFVLAANAVVVASDDRSTTIAVPVDDTPRVALGIVTGSVVPALRPG